MIESMKKTVVVCMAQDQDLCVSQLRDLGILHITGDDSTASHEYEEERRIYERVKTVAEVLQKNLPAEVKNEESKLLPWRDIVDQVFDLINYETLCRERLNHFQNCAQQMKPWGTFNQQDIERMAKEGLQVVLFSTPIEEVPKLPDPIVIQEVSRSANNVYMMALAPLGVEIPVEPFVFPAETDVKVINAQIEKYQQGLQQIAQKLRDIAVLNYTLITHQEAELAERLNFLQARDKMGSGHELVYLQGFIPEKDLGKIEAAAKKNGWALLVTDPSEDEPVPTLLKIPKLFSCAKSVFDFLGIVPDYREIDVAVPVVIFLVLFAAILVGDAAYGIILLIVCSIIRLKAKNETVRLGATLLNTMAVTTIIWGALNGTWFAIDSDKLPKCMRGLDWLTNPETKDAHQQLVMFTIGIVHLLLGHFMFICTHARKRWRSLIGNMGWISFLFGNYVVITNMLVFQRDIPSWVVWAYIPGLIGILINVQWTDIGGVFNLPFSLINSMVDLASYIRLFAVGMAGFYIAASVNTVSSMLTELGPIGYVLMVILMVLGHTLNIALCLMSVMVHAIRLNTLEFSNHAVISWSGSFYHPFKKISTDEGN